MERFDPQVSGIVFVHDRNIVHELLRNMNQEFVFSSESNFGKIRKTIRANSNNFAMVLNMESLVKSIFLKNELKGDCKLIAWHINKFIVNTKKSYVFDNRILMDRCNMTKFLTDAKKLKLTVIMTCDYRDYYTENRSVKIFKFADYHIVKFFYGILYGKIHREQVERYFNGPMLFIDKTFVILNSAGEIHTAFTKSN